jgi:glycosyltransferase involved in cell wall biosynthesis
MDAFLTKLKQKVLSGDCNHDQRIAIIIKTINRKGSLFATINSIYDFSDLPFRLYIADDGRIDKEQAEFYSLLQEEGHVVRTYNQPIAVTKALNELVQSTTTEQFILRIDDDFRFCKDTRVSVLRHILEDVPAIGAISGIERLVRKAQNIEMIESKQGFFIHADHILFELLMDVHKFPYTHRKCGRFAIVHYARNFLLIRRNVFDSVSWNEDLLFKGEHVDFSLRLAKAGWLLAFTPDCIHEHHDDGVPTAVYTGRDVAPAAAARERVMVRDHGIKEVRRLHLAEVIKRGRRKGLLGSLGRKIGF